MNPDREQIKLNVLNQVEDLVRNRLNKVKPIMDDVDAGQADAYEKVLSDINAYKSIINHTSNYQQIEPGIDY